MVSRPTPCEAKRLRGISARTHVPRFSVILVSPCLSRAATHCQLPTARPLAHWAAGDLPPALRAREAAYSCSVVVFLANTGKKGRIGGGGCGMGMGRRQMGFAPPRALGEGRPGLAFSCPGPSRSAHSEPRIPEGSEPEVASRGSAQPGVPFQPVSPPGIALLRWGLAT